MQSSLDDLLDEIDSALTTAPKKPAAAPAPPPQSDIDDLLSELSDLGGHSAQRAAPHPVQPQPTAIAQPKRVEKCYALCISGTQTAKGISFSSVEPRVCATMRCTGCDHTVLSFPDSAWADDCEYYFFRNNYQRPALLQQVRTMQKLQFRQGWVAFYCQCTWRHVNEPQPLKFDKWVCGGH